MKLVPPLLNAILRLDGEALVLHVGEKPYVVATTGQVELTSRPLNLDAVSGMVSQLLPSELQRALDEFGAVQYEFPALPEFSNEHFSVVAARGGDDIWIEVRRRRVHDDVPVSAPASATAASATPHDDALPVDETMLTTAAAHSRLVVPTPQDEPEQPRLAAEHDAERKQGMSAIARESGRAQLESMQRSGEPPAISQRAVSETVGAVDETQGEIDLAIDLEAVVAGEIVVRLAEIASSDPLAAPLPLDEEPEVELAFDLDSVTPSGVADETVMATTSLEQSADLRPYLESETRVQVELECESSTTPELPLQAATSTRAPHVVEIASSGEAEQEVELTFDLDAAAVPAVLVDATVTTPERPTSDVAGAARRELIQPEVPPTLATASPLGREPQPSVFPSPAAVAGETPSAVVVEPSSLSAIVSVSEPQAPPLPAVVDETSLVPLPLACTTPAPPVLRAEETMPAPTMSMQTEPVQPPHEPTAGADDLECSEEATAAPSFNVVTGFTRPQEPAHVLPIARGAMRGEAQRPVIDSAATALDRLLRIAATRGASALYLTSQAQPSIRCESGIQALADEALLSSHDVESMLADVVPERKRDEIRRGVTTEWTCDIADVGRVGCMTFRDHRGAGAIFRIRSLQAISADQLGLSREIQALAAEPDGLILVTGARASGKSTLVSAFVNLINRSRHDHVITIEEKITVVHEPRCAFVSQREVRGGADDMLGAARAAMRENPDVLVIEDLQVPDVVDAALECAGSGCLVITSVPANTAAGALERIIGLYLPGQRQRVQLALAETLRGVVAQVLVRKPAGGSVAAREVLLNTPAVASVIAEGKMSQLALAIESGREYGMVPLNDALVGLVQTGSVDPREAYKRAADRSGFVALLKQQGVDTSFAERLA